MFVCAADIRTSPWSVRRSGSRHSRNCSLYDSTPQLPIPRRGTGGPAWRHGPSTRPCCTSNLRFGTQRTDRACRRPPVLRRFALPRRRKDTEGANKQVQRTLNPLRLRSSGHSWRSFRSGFGSADLGVRIIAKFILQVFAPSALMVAPHATPRAPVFVCCRVSRLSAFLALPPMRRSVPGDMKRGMTARRTRRWSSTPRPRGIGFLHVISLAWRR